MTTTAEWMKLKRYCERTGETSGAVHKRRARKQWIDGVHCKLDPHGHLWINYTEAQLWVESGTASPSLRALRSETT